MVRGTSIKQSMTVKHKNKASIIGKSLERGTKLVSITKNITTVRTIVDIKLILSPPPFGRNTYRRERNEIARPGTITVTVKVEPCLLMIRL